MHFLLAAGRQRRETKKKCLSLPKCPKTAHPYPGLHNNLSPRSGRGRHPLKAEILQDLPRQRMLLVLQLPHVLRKIALNLYVATPFPPKHEKIRNTDRLRTGKGGKSAYMAYNILFV